MRYGDAPERKNANDVYFERTLQEADKTLEQQREESEYKINNVKVKLLNDLATKNKKLLREIKSLDLDLAEETANYKNQLQSKYAKKYANSKMSDAKIQKKIELEVQNFIHKKKIENLKAEYKETLENINDRKKASLAASQKENKSFKDRVKDWRAFNKEQTKAQEKTAKKLRKEGATELEIMEATGKLSAKGIGEAVFSKETTDKIADNLINGIKQAFESTIQTYGNYQAKINTRLQGSGRTWNGLLGAGFGIGGIESNLKNLIGINPYIKLQAVMDNVVKATEAGIANNIEQRAFLATISENIASTFNAFDSNLLRVIRLQQKDTTASRLGMEAGITAFLNNYFADNSYLNSAFDTVSQNLVEAISQLGAEEAVGVEYQIQKWLGSLYSVGFSESAVGSISQALGYLGSGDISSLSGNSALQNLLVMSMNKANLSYSDILADGLDSSSVNTLMKSMVQYLQEIAQSDNNIVKSQLAQVFGMSISDIKAATNLASSLKAISDSSMNYGDSMKELYYQMSAITSRMSVAGMLQNLYDNVTYSMGTSIASNPATYALWQITSAIEDLTGGINLPTVSVMGSSVDLNTTVTNLMRAGIVGASTLGSIGSIISGLSSSVIPASMLLKLGIFGSEARETKSRGGQLNRRKNALNQLSKSTYVGNTAGDDYYSSTITKADLESQQRIEAKKSESTDRTLNDVHEYLLSVFDPKITEIERLTALMAGYSAETSNWGSFKNSSDIAYNATTVTVKSTDANINEMRAKNSELLASISSNTKDIYALLKLVISESGLKIDNDPLTYLSRISDNGGLV